ncbi:hypothetical protein WEI85_03260 [Actinomycetes bacterium KLBMP 9797]|jgi:hypothetical protein
MTIGPEDVGNGSTAIQERFAGGYHPARRDGGLPMDSPQEPDHPIHNGSPLGVTAASAAPHAADPARWLDSPASGSLVDHPLLRGLLMELPPRDSMPPSGWMDRWFEAARSILELLYLQDSGRR